MLPYLDMQTRCMIIQLCTNYYSKATIGNLINRWKVIALISYMLIATLYTGKYSWWRHQMETISALLAICAGNLPVSGEFPTQRPETRSCDVFFDLRLNKRLSKQPWGWWFETLSRPLWGQGTVTGLNPEQKEKVPQPKETEKHIHWKDPLYTMKFKIRHQLNDLYLHKFERHTYVLINVMSIKPCKSFQKVYINCKNEPQNNCFG